MTADLVVKHDGSVYSELFLGRESLGASVLLCKQQNIFQENLVFLSLWNG